VGRGEGGGADNRLSTLLCKTMIEFFTLGLSFLELKVIILRMYLTFAFVYTFSVPTGATTHCGFVFCSTLTGL